MLGINYSFYQKVKIYKILISWKFTDSLMKVHRVQIVLFSNLLICWTYWLWMLKMHEWVNLMAQHVWLFYFDIFFKKKGFQKFIFVLKEITGKDVKNELWTVTDYHSIRKQCLLFQ